MPSTYSGNPANYPSSVTRPDDGDDIDAASVNVAIEGLMDRTAFLLANGGARLLTGAGPHQLAANDRYVVHQPGAGQVIRLSASPTPGRIHFIGGSISGTMTVQTSTGAAITRNGFTQNLMGIETAAFFMWNGNNWVGSQP